MQVSQPLCGANREVLFQDTRRKRCWLPIDESSPWQYCRHCSFSQKDAIIEAVIKNIVKQRDEILMPTGTKEKLLTVLEYPWFREHCAHPASRVRLYHLMLLMKKQNVPLYSSYLRDPGLSPSFIRIIQSHRPQDSTAITCTLICDLVGKDRLRIPRQCPLCLYTLWKKDRNNREKYAALTSYLREYERKAFHFPNPYEILKDYIRHSVRIGDSNRQYALSAIFVHLNRRAPQEANERLLYFLQDFLLEDSQTFAALVEKNMEVLMKYSPQWLYPVEFETGVVDPARALWKQCMKARCDTYKEELMIKTCHPKRLFKWIFDIEELKDFEPLDEELDLSFLDSS
jgi:hypothetical protein